MSLLDRRVTLKLLGMAAGMGWGNSVTALESGALDATRTNWLTAPYNKWAFHNVEKVISVVSVPAGSFTREDFPEGHADLSGFSLNSGGNNPLTLQAWLRATDTDAIIILKDGRLVYEFYDNGTSRTTPHILHSSTKAVMGLLLGILAHDGLLDMEAPAEHYVPALAATGYSGATLRNLIDMRAGVVPTSEQALENANAASAIPATPGGPIPTFHGVIDTLKAAQRPHGGNFNYISVNTQVVGWVIEHATGRKVADLISEKLWKPLGAQSGAYMGVDREGAPWCAGGFCATARDFAMIGDLVLNDGRRESHEIVPSSWITDLSAGGDREAWAQGEWGQLFAPLSPNMNYRSGWYTIHDDPELLFAMGVHGQNLFIDRKNNIAIAKLSSWPKQVDPQRMGLTHLAIRELRRCLEQTSH
jgi:CubicO group peptidase (beta-lactamase class C family)